MTLSPGAALWHQRHAVAELCGRFEALGTAIGCLSDLHLYQWSEFAAFALQFRPDLIIELGRGFGNSTCCFIEVAHRLGGADSCRVLSLCRSERWFSDTLPRLNGLIPKAWLEPARIEVCDLLAYDATPWVARSNRCLVLWDAHGFDVAEWVLGRLLPSIRDKRHILLAHDLSDARYEPEPLEVPYGETGIWKGTNAGLPTFYLGDIFSNVAQAISIVDFCSRNQIVLHSAAESLNEEIVLQAERLAALKDLLGENLFSAQAHWYWFTMNETSGCVHFPRYTGAADVTLEGLSRRIQVLEQERVRIDREKEEVQLVLQRMVQSYREQISQLEFEKHQVATTLAAVENSPSWRVLNRWRRARDRFAPKGTWPRRMYDMAVRRLGSGSSKS